MGQVLLSEMSLAKQLGMDKLGRRPASVQYISVTKFAMDPRCLSLIVLSRTPHMIKVSKIFHCHMYRQQNNANLYSSPLWAINTKHTNKYTIINNNQ